MYETVMENAKQNFDYAKMNNLHMIEAELEHTYKNSVKVYAEVVKKYFESAPVE